MPGRRRVAVSLSSEEDYSDDAVTPAKDTRQLSSPRSSERLSARKRREFHMPDRTSVLDKIKPSPSGKSLERVKPRKLVNNFTRVTHRYNYDKASSDDSENDDFIDDDPLPLDSSDEDESDGEKSVAQSSGSDKNCSLRLHHMSRLESDSDTDAGKSEFKHNSLVESDSDNNSDKHNSLVESGSDNNSDNSLVESDSDNNSDLGNSPGNSLVNRRLNESVPLEDKDDSTIEKEKGCHTQVDLHSSEDSESKLILPSVSSQKKARQIRGKKRMFESSSGSDSDSPCDQETSRIEYMTPGSSDSLSDSDEAQRLYSSNEDSEKLPSERIQFMASRRKVRKNLLDELAAKRRK